MGDLLADEAKDILDDRVKQFLHVGSVTRGNNSEP
jgi:hypothetical protein